MASQRHEQEGKSRVMAEKFSEDLAKGNRMFD